MYLTSSVSVRMNLFSYRLRRIRPFLKKCEGELDIPQLEDLDSLAQYWQDQLEKSRKPKDLAVISSPENLIKPKEPMKFFIGYSYSKEAPFGLTVGGIKSRLGWYARFRTNLKFNSYEGKCEGYGQMIEPVIGGPFIRFTNNQKVNTYAGVAGIIFKCTSWLYTSVGLGYGNRELLCEYKSIDAVDHTKETTYWCKNIDYSYNGLAGDLDFMVKFGSIYVSAGCNTLNFKYIDFNAGLGVFF